MVYASRVWGTRSRDQNVTGQKWAESGRFLIDISR